MQGYGDPSVVPSLACLPDWAEWSVRSLPGLRPRHIGSASGWAGVSCPFSRRRRCSPYRLSMLAHRWTGSKAIIVRYRCCWVLAVGVT